MAVIPVLQQIVDEQSMRPIPAPHGRFMNRKSSFQEGWHFFIFTRFGTV